MIKNFLLYLDTCVNKLLYRLFSKDIKKNITLLKNNF